MAKKKAGTALKAVTRLAKQIKKKNPRKKWATCLKEAGRQYKKR